MLLGVLRMPPNCWSPTEELDVMQRHSRYLEAADRIESDATEIERLHTGILKVVQDAENNWCGRGQMTTELRRLLDPSFGLNQEGQ